MSISRCNSAYWLGRQDFIKVLELQNLLFEKKLSGEAPDSLLLVEHNHIYTIGRGFLPAGAGSEKNKVNLEVDYINIDRGGGLTYHGPGQLVCYPSVFLKSRTPDLKLYLRRLEEIIIMVLEEFKISGYRIIDLTGVWVSGKKIASIGVKVTQGCTKHGFSINIDPDLSFFKKIKPCGLDGELVTSLNEITGKKMEIMQIAKMVAKFFSEIFSADYQFINLSKDEDAVKKTTKLVAG